MKETPRSLCRCEISCRWQNCVMTDTNLPVLWRFCHSGVYDMQLPVSRRFYRSGVEEVRLPGSLATVFSMWKKRDSLGFSDFVILVLKKWNYPRHEYLTSWCRWSETDRVTATLTILMWRTWEGKSHSSFAILVCRKWDNVCTLGWLYPAGIWLYCDCFIWVYLVLCLFNLYCGGFILFCNACVCVFCNVWVFW